MKKIVLCSLPLAAMLMFAQAQTTTVQEQADIDPNGASSSCVSIESNLRVRMKDASEGGDVTLLQDFLIAYGFMQGQPTGYFGQATLTAVKRFQQRSSLSPTGYVGPLTRAKVKDISCNGLPVAEAKNPSGENKLKPGMEKIACTMEARLCSDGSMMPRGANCEWYPNKCGMKQASTSPEVMKMKSELEQKMKDLQASREVLKKEYEAAIAGGTVLTEEQKKAFEARKEELRRAELDLMKLKERYMDEWGMMGQMYAKKMASTSTPPNGAMKSDLEKNMHMLKDLQNGKMPNGEELNRLLKEVDMKLSNGSLGEADKQMLEKKRQELKKVIDTISTMKPGEGDMKKYYTQPVEPKNQMVQ